MVGAVLFFGRIWFGFLFGHVVDDFVEFVGAFLDDGFSGSAAAERGDELVGAMFAFAALGRKEAVAIFFEENLNAAGDRDGNNSANETESVDAEGDRGEDDEGWKLKAFALDFWRDEVRLDLEIYDCVDEEDDAGRKGVESEKDSDDGAANDGAEHWDEAEGAGDEAEWQGEVSGEFEDLRQNENGEGSGGGVNEGDRDGVRNVLGDDFAHAFEDAFGAHDAVVGAEVGPELMKNVWAFDENEKCEHEDEDEFRDEVAESANGSHEVIADVGDEI